MIRRLYYDNGLFRIECDYSDKDIVKEKGFFWDSFAGLWTTKNIKNAMSFKEFAQGTAEDLLDSFNENYNSSFSSSANIEVPKNENLTLDYFPYQKAGIKTAFERKNILIADEMGLGKTIQAIGVVNVVNEAEKIVVVCPASLKENWKNEFSKWMFRNLSIEVMDSKKPYSGTTNILIVNYDILTKSGIDKIKWDIMIVDECHMVKNKNTVRAKYVHSIKADRNIFMTGTPILNRPDELFPTINFLNPALFSEAAYKKRYCWTFNKESYSYDKNSPRNLTELQSILRGTVMIRRMKQDVLKELPEKTRQIIAIKPNGEAKKAVENEMRFYKSLKNKLTISDIGKITSLRKESAMFKVEHLKEHISNCIQQGKIVVFAHHKEIINKIYSEFKDVSVILTGETKIEERQSVVKRFNEDENVKLFIGSMKAAGVGFTLTASNHVIFCELDWTPEIMNQAESRCHRIGQKNNVTVQYFVLEGSIDEYIYDMVHVKGININKAMNTDKVSKAKKRTYKNKSEKDVDSI